jgi:hypothetical protein
VLIAETAAVGVQEPRRASVTRTEFSVFPNPAGTLVRVQFGRPFGCGSRVSLYDAAGRRVLVKQIGKEDVSTELKLNGLGPGLYFVRVESKTGVRSGKLVRK